MKKTHVLLLAFILTMTVLLGGTWWAMADTNAPPAADTNPKPSYLSPDYPYPPRPGIYVFQGPYGGLLPEGNEDLGTTFPIRGHVTVFNWSDLHDVNSAGQDVFYFGSIDAWLREMCNRPNITPRNRYAAFYINLYEDSGQAKIPRYMWDPSHPGYSKRGNRDEAIIPYGVIGIPKYQTSYFQEQYRRLIFRLANRYRNRGDCIAFIGIGTGRHGETWPVNPLSNPTEASLAQASGLTGGRGGTWVAYMKNVVDAYVDAFSQGCDGLCIPLMIQAAPYFTSPAEREEITDYAASKGVGDSHNGLYPDQEGARLNGQGQYDPLLKHQGEVPLAFETYSYMLEHPLNSGCDTDQQVYWAMLNGLDKHIDFLRPHVDLLLRPGPDPNDPYAYPCPWGYCQYPDSQIKKANVRIFRWMSQYLGARRDNTPSVWVALREHRTPWYVCWQGKDSNPPRDFGPEVGNFDFWLYQVDDVAGGKTVPETNQDENHAGIPVDHMGTNFTPYNPNLPAIREAWYIRRTDEVTGNPYMFFNVDDSYLLGSARVTITISYIDMYTDTFTLYYENLAGVETPAEVSAIYEVPAIFAQEDERTPVPVAPGTTSVPKQGTKTLRQAIFVLNDARMRNGLTGGTDFYISSNNDGDEWVHMVNLEMDRSSVTPEPTPTPTATATPTPTNTPTPTATPTTAYVNGLVWNDVSRDSLYDTGEPPLADVTVQLLDQDTRNVRYEQTTDSDGRYTFPAVDPGTYVLKVVVPAGYAPVFFDEVPVGALTGGQVVQVDFALYQLPTPTPTVSPTPTLTPTLTPTPTPTLTPTLTPTPTPEPAIVQGVVFDDANGNGDQDSGEPGLAGVEITLFRSGARAGGTDDTLVATVATDGSGAFTFTVADSGSYRLVQGFVFAYRPEGGYERPLTVEPGRVYQVNIPNKAVTYRWLPIVVR